MEVNYEWVKQQFTEAKVRVGVGKAVLKMLETWESLDLTPEQARQSLEILSSVGLGHSLVVVNKDEVWVDVRRGDIKVGDQVRVMHDAFDGDMGSLHNGRRGVVGAIRSGDIIVKMTDGKSPTLEGVHYSPDKLQKRIR
jgi:hypothetical protein